MKRFALLVPLAILLYVAGTTVLATASTAREAADPIPATTATPGNDWNVAGTIEQMNGEFWDVQGFVFRVTSSTVVQGDVPSVGTYASASGIVLSDGTWQATTVTVGSSAATATPTSTATATPSPTPIPTDTPIPPATSTPIPPPPTATTAPHVAAPRSAVSPDRDDSSPHQDQPHIGQSHADQGQGNDHSNPGQGNGHSNQGQGNGHSPAPPPHPAHPVHPTHPQAPGLVRLLDLLRHKSN